jgi:beta-galactosidase
MANQPPPGHVYSWNQGWLFGGFAEGAAEPGFDESGLTPVTLPHTVTPLSWGDWDPAGWQRVWIYRKHFGRPARRGWRVLADFDGAMVDATVVLNGVALGTHTGGYLPWTTELTGHLSDGDNVLAVIVDSRWLPVPPDGSGLPGLRIDGYLGSRLAASARMSADPAADRLSLTADDQSILADGTDATRLTFRAVDAYGNQRRGAGSRVRLSLTGPATLVGDNPFDFALYGGVGGAFVRSLPGRPGAVTVTATHPSLGQATVTLRTVTG